MDRVNFMEWVRKYRYVLLVLAAGMLLMLLPDRQEAAAQDPVPEPAAADTETRLEQILSRMEGAGEVAVMLTQARAEEVTYQTDGEDTVLVTDSARNEQGLVRTRHPPIYRGAIVVCTGAGSPAVRLAVVEAVSNITGLGSDKITVLKME